VEVLEVMPGWPGIKLKIEPFVLALSTIKEKTHALAVIPMSHYSGKWDLTINRFIAFSTGLCEHRPELLRFFRLVRHQPVEKNFQN
jgi:hypothetical protein